MYKPCDTFLVESDPGETELVNPGEYRESTSPVQGDVGSASGGVGSSEPGATDRAIVLWATISGGDPKRNLDYVTQVIQSVEEINGHLVVTAATTTGELFTYKMLPLSFYFSTHEEPWTE